MKNKEEREKRKKHLKQIWRTHFRHSVTKGELYEKIVCLRSKAKKSVKEPEERVSGTKI